MEENKENLNPNTHGGNGKLTGGSRNPTLISLLHGFSNLSITENQWERIDYDNRDHRRDENKEEKREEEHRGAQDQRARSSSNLFEVDDEDIFSITYNGVTVEKRARNLHALTQTCIGKVVATNSRKATKTILFSSEPRGLHRQIKKIKLKQLARIGTKDINGAKRRMPDRQGDEAQMKVCCEEGVNVKVEATGASLCTTTQAL